MSTQMDERKLKEFLAKYNNLGCNGALWLKLIPENLHYALWAVANIYYNKLLDDVALRHLGGPVIDSSLHSTPWIHGPISVKNWTSKRMMEVLDNYKTTITKEQYLLKSSLHRDLQNQSKLTLERFLSGSLFYRESLKTLEAYLAEFQSRHGKILKSDFLAGLKD